MIPYRFTIAAMPEERATKVTVLILDEWQKEALDAFAAQILTARQLVALDDAVIRNLANTLHEEAEDHLQREAGP